MSDAPVTLLLVDDSRDLTEVFALMARMEGWVRLVGVLHSADGLVAAVAEHAPDVVLLDLTMPGREPLEALGEVAREHPGTRVVVYSGYDDEQTVASAVAAGAWGFASKHLDVPGVLAVVRRVADGERVLPR